MLLFVVLIQYELVLQFTKYNILLNFFILYLTLWCKMSKFLLEKNRRKLLFCLLFIKNGISFIIFPCKFTKILIHYQSLCLCLYVPCEVKIITFQYAESDSMRDYQHRSLWNMSWGYWIFLTELLIEPNNNETISYLTSFWFNQISSLNWK